MEVWIMVTYEKICRNPQVARALIGMSLTEFENLYGEFELAYSTRAGSLGDTRPDTSKRRRAGGGGRKHKYSLRDRLLMALFWLRAFTTYEVLGSLYKLDKTTVHDNLKDVLGTLASMGTLNLEYPPSDIPKLHSVQEVINALPELRLILEAEQKGIS